MLKTMMGMFLVFSVLMVAPIVIYQQDDGLIGLSNYSKA